MTRRIRLTLPIALLLASCGAHTEREVREASPTCRVLPAECGDALGWIDCDDCAATELVGRGPASSLVSCLAEALRCGPDEDLRRRHEAQGRPSTWREHFRLRAADGLGALHPESRETLRQIEVEHLPTRVAAAVERARAIYETGTWPPAGLSACDGGAGMAEVEAASACFEARVRPALLALGERDAGYRFGRDSTRLALYGASPRASAQPDAWPALERALRGLPPDTRSAITALGALERVHPDGHWVVVEIVLEPPGMPSDGAARLLFVVETETLHTVLVVRAIL